MMIRIEYDHEPERGSAFVVSQGFGQVSIAIERLEDGRWIRRIEDRYMCEDDSVMVDVAIAIIRMAGAEQDAINRLTADPDSERRDDDARPNP